MLKIKDNQIDMITASGHIVNYANPDLTIVDPKDIEIHTTNICRYNGALKWNLVQHLALCVLLASEDNINHKIRYKASSDKNELLIQTAFCASHDFHEIYCTDVVSGLKKYLPEYCAIENTWEAYVHKKLDLPLKLRNNDFVKYVDTRALVIEMTCLGHPGADVVASRYGGTITATERCIFGNLVKHSNSSCWDITWNAFNSGRQTNRRDSEYILELL